MPEIGMNRCRWYKLFFHSEATSSQIIASSKPLQKDSGEIFRVLLDEWKILEKAERQHIQVGKTIFQTAREEERLDRGQAIQRQSKRSSFDTPICQRRIVARNHRPKDFSLDDHKKAKRGIDCDERIGYSDRGSSLRGLIAGCVNAPTKEVVNSSTAVSGPARIGKIRRTLHERRNKGGRKIRIGLSGLRNNRSYVYSDEKDS